MDSQSFVNEFTFNIILNYSSLLKTSYKIQPNIISFVAKKSKYLYLSLNIHNSRPLLETEALTLINVRIDFLKSMSYISNNLSDTSESNMNLS